MAARKALGIMGVRIRAIAGPARGIRGATRRDHARRRYVAGPAGARDSKTALLDRDEARAVGTADTQQVPVLLRRAQRGDRLLGRAHRPTVHLDHDVARLEARALGRAAPEHVGHDRALRAAFEPERART